MRRGFPTWILVGLSACAATRAGEPAPLPRARPSAPPRVPAPSPEACQTQIREGDDRFDAGDWPAAVDAYRQALAQCPDARPTSLKLARGLGAIDQHDAAADVLAALVTAPEPPLEAFTELARLRDRLSAAARLRISQLGSAADRPVHVPAIRFEYSWLGTFACEDGHPQVSGQKLLKSNRGTLDELDFTCGNGPARSVFFDFSADPTERALRRELGASP